jgi:Transposase domain (DUF772)
MSLSAPQAMKTSAAEWNDRLNPIVTRVLVDPREKPAPFYSNIGRPSIDPELMIRMLIVGYCYCIRFERKLWTRSSANWILSLLWPPRPSRRLAEPSLLSGGTQHLMEEVRRRAGRTHWLNTTQLWT